MLSALLAIGEGTKAEEVGREAERAVPKRAIVGHLRSSLLLARGEPTAALKALESARKQKPEGYRPDTILEEEIRQAIRLEPLARKLDAVLGGREAPVDESERATLADLALRRGRSAASAKLFREAFARQPALSDNLQAGHRARAALAAVRAGLGIDADEPKAEETARAAWRRQGLDWLRAELEARGKVADDGKATLKDHNAWTRTLRIWKRYRDLAGVREAKALDGLPETERDGWRLFWAEVDRRLSRTGEGPAMNYQDHIMALVREANDKYPGSATARISLAGELAREGKLDEAMPQYREAAQSKPKDPEAHWAFGQEMLEQGRYEEATVALKEAVRHKPDNADYFNALCVALFRQRKYAEAAEVERKATELEPSNGLLWLNLGRSLDSQAKFEEAVPAFRQAVKLAKDDQSSKEYAKSLAEAERKATLNARLPALLRGGDRPKDDSEKLTLARICASRGLDAASARFYAAVLDTKPGMAGDLEQPHGYPAAVSSARGGCSLGKDDPSPDDGTRARFRARSLSWLRERLGSWEKLVGDGKGEARKQVVVILTNWQKDPDTACVREPESLAKVPKDERQAWRSFWTDVESLLAKARGERR